MEIQEERLVHLEEKICYCDDLIEVLNRTIYQQQLQIDALQAGLRALRQQIELGLPAEHRNLRDEIPPHY